YLPLRGPVPCRLVTGEAHLAERPAHPPFAGPQELIVHPDDQVIGVEPEGEPVPAGLARHSWRLVPPERRTDFVLLLPPAHHHPPRAQPVPLPPDPRSDQPLGPRRLARVEEVDAQPAGGRAVARPTFGGLPCERQQQRLLAGRVLPVAEGGLPRQPPALQLAL